MTFKIVSFLAFASAIVAQKCPIQFEGRVSACSTPASFDAPTSLFSTGFVKGANLTWSQIIRLPQIPVSLFDKKNGTKAIEITLSDASIFAPSATNVQKGFRRAELLPASNNGTDPSTTGIKTLHFSIRKDNDSPLNLTHEYQLAFIESADYSTNQFVLKTGTINGAAAGQDKDLLVLQGNVRNATNLFTVPFKKDLWHNFALGLDFTKNTVTVYYSNDHKPLKKVTRALPNDISGQGQFHFGALKKPVGKGLTDVTKQGFQPSNINEGIIYGGIFEEDSANGCVSLTS